MSASIMHRKSAPAWRASSIERLRLIGMGVSAIRELSTLSMRGSLLHLITVCTNQSVVSGCSAPPGCSPGNRKNMTLYFGTAGSSPKGVKRDVSPPTLLAGPPGVTDENPYSSTQPRTTSLAVAPAALPADSVAARVLPWTAGLSGGVKVSTPFV